MQGSRVPHPMFRAKTADWPNVRDATKYPRLFPGQFDEAVRPATSPVPMHSTTKPTPSYMDAAGEALSGIAADVLGNTPRKRWTDIFIHGDRLRGLGTLLVAIAVVGIVIDYMMASTPELCQSTELRM